MLWRGVEFFGRGPLDQFAKVHDADLVADVLDRLDAEAAPYLAASAAGRDVYDGRFTRRTGW